MFNQRPIWSCFVKKNEDENSRDIVPLNSPLLDGQLFSPCQLLYAYWYQATTTCCTSRLHESNPCAHSYSVLHCVPIFSHSILLQSRIIQYSTYRLRGWIVNPPAVYSHLPFSSSLEPVYICLHNYASFWNIRAAATIKYGVGVTVPAISLADSGRTASI
jgi:hypothetical protein